MAQVPVLQMIVSFVANVRSEILGTVVSSVSDPHSFDTDPDPNPAI
jgi:hypothetical protein